MPKDKSEKLIEAEWVQIDADIQYKENLRQLELDHRLFKLLKNIKVSLVNYLNARGEVI